MATRKPVKKVQKKVMKSSVVKKSTKSTKSPAVTKAKKPTQKAVASMIELEQEVEDMANDGTPDTEGPDGAEEYEEGFDDVEISEEEL